MISTPMFGQLFARDRFSTLLKYLHFNNNSDQANENSLHKIKPVINESLTLWKGRFSFKQYIPIKRNRFGIKVFVICDCQSGTLLDLARNFNMTKIWG